MRTTWTTPWLTNDHFPGYPEYGLGMLMSWFCEKTLRRVFPSGKIKDEVRLTIGIRKRKGARLIRLRVMKTTWHGYSLRYTTSATARPCSWLGCRPGRWLSELPGMKKRIKSGKVFRLWVSAEYK